MVTQNEVNKKIKQAVDLYQTLDNEQKEEFNQIFANIVKEEIDNEILNNIKDKNNGNSS